MINNIVRFARPPIGRQRTKNICISDSYSMVMPPVFSLSFPMAIMEYIINDYGSVVHPLLVQY